MEIRYVKDEASYRATALKDGDTYTATIVLRNKHKGKPPTEVGLLMMMIEFVQKIKESAKA